MRRTIHTLAMVLLGAVYLQLAAGGQLQMIVFPATSKQPHALTPSAAMPKPEKRPVWVPARYLPLTSTIALEIPPCVPSPSQGDALFHRELTLLPEKPVGFCSYRSALLANKAPPQP